MFVSMWMSRNLVTVTPETPVSEALQIMRNHNIRRLPVVLGKELAGFVTLGDIHRAEPSNAGQVIDWDHQEAVGSTPISKIMSVDPIKIKENATLEDAAEIMIDQKVGSLPVVDSGNHLVGVITSSDVMRALRRFLGAGAEGARVVVKMSDGFEGLPKILKLIRAKGCEVKAVCLGRGFEDEDRPHLLVLRLKGGDVNSVLEALKMSGHAVLDSGER